MTIIPRALVNHVLRCDVQDCHACGGQHVGMNFFKLPSPCGKWTRFSFCTNPSNQASLPEGSKLAPVLMTEAQAGPFAEGKD